MSNKDFMNLMKSLIKEEIERRLAREREDLRRRHEEERRRRRPYDKIPTVKEDDTQFTQERLSSQEGFTRAQEGFTRAQDFGSAAKLTTATGSIKNQPIEDADALLFEQITRQEEEIKRLKELFRQREEQRKREEREATELVEEAFFADEFL